MSEPCCQITDENISNWMRSLTSTKGKQGGAYSCSSSGTALRVSAERCSNQGGGRFRDSLSEVYSVITFIPCFRFNHVVNIRLASAWEQLVMLKGRQKYCRLWKKT